MLWVTLERRWNAVHLLCHPSRQFLLPFHTRGLTLVLPQLAGLSTSLDSVRLFTKHFVQIMHTSHLLGDYILARVQFSRSVVADSLRPHELQRTRPPCPSPTPGVYSNSCPSCQWCHPASHPLSSPSPPAVKSFPASGSFQMSQLSTWGGQSIGVSASTSVPPMNTQDWSPLGTDIIKEF